MTKEKDYLEFVEAVEQEIAQSFKLSRERIWLQKEENRDRILVENVYDNGLKSVMGIEAAGLFLLYKRGTSIEALVDQMKRDWERKCTKQTMDIFQDMEDYEKLRGRLIVRAVNSKARPEHLENAVFQRVGDILLVVYLVLSETEYDFLSAKLQRSLLKKWGLSKEEVFDNAMINTHILYPPRIYDWTKGLKKFPYSEGAFMNPLEHFELKKTPLGNCLTNVKQLNGATTLFYPGVAKRLSYLLGEDFYAAFTSIHEVMLHGVSSIDLSVIEASLESVNENNEEDEILSQKVYYYSSKEDKIMEARGL